MAPVLLWAALSHLMLQIGVHLGRERGGERGGGERWGSELHVSLSSVSAGAGLGGGVPGQLRGPEEEEVNGVAAGSKKHGFRVSSSEVAQTYHLLHQIHMTGQ